MQDKMPGMQSTFTCTAIAPHNAKSENTSLLLTTSAITLTRPLLMKPGVSGAGEEGLTSTQASEIGRQHHTVPTGWQAGGKALSPWDRMTFLEAWHQVRSLILMLLSNKFCW